MTRRLAGLALTTLPLLAGLVLSAPADARAGSSGSHGASGSHGSASSHGSYSHGSSGFGVRSRSRRGQPSGADGDGLPVWVLAPFLGAFGLLVFAASRATKQEEADRAEALVTIVPEAARRDPVWQEDDLLQQAKDAFMAVQNAWAKRNQDLAAHAMTPRLYDRHRTDTDAMRARGEVNVLEGMHIRSASIVRLQDRLDDAQDKVWVKFTAEAVDYTFAERDSQVLAGDYRKPTFFTEIWVFRRQGNAWLADEILDADAPLPVNVVET